MIFNRSMLLLLLTISLQLAIPLKGNALELEVITLQHRPAESIVNSLRPLLNKNESIVASDSRLLIRTTPENLAQIQLLIDELDQPLAQLLISVRRGGTGKTEQHRYAVNGQLKTGNITINNKTGSSSTSRSVTIYRGTSNKENSGVHQVRATEGYPSFINTGEQVPVVSEHHHLTTHTHTSTTLKSVVRGFYATARLLGKERVIVELDSRHENAKNQAIETSTYTGTLTGRLGEWLPVAGHHHNDTSQTHKITRYRSTKDLQDSTIFIKIERL